MTGMMVEHGDRGGDPLVVWGRPLFAGALLTDQLEAQVRARVIRERDDLFAIKRRVSRLQLRRRLAELRMPGAVTIAPGQAMTEIAGGIGGYPAARLISRIAGDPGHFDYAPSADRPRRLPLAVVDGDRLIITVRFPEQDRRYVALLAQAELMLIERMVAGQGAALARFTPGLPELVRRLVDEAWPAPEPEPANEVWLTM